MPCYPIVVFKKLRAVAGSGGVPLSCLSVEIAHGVGSNGVRRVCVKEEVDTIPLLAKNFSQALLTVLDRFSR